MNTTVFSYTWQQPERKCCACNKPFSDRSMLSIVQKKIDDRVLACYKGMQLHNRCSVVGQNSQEVLWWTMQRTIQARGASFGQPSNKSFLKTCISVPGYQQTSSHRNASKNPEYLMVRIVETNDFVHRTTLRQIALWSKSETWRGQDGMPLRLLRSQGLPLLSRSLTVS